MWCAIANSVEGGRIPGKAKNGICYYALKGTEYKTDDFVLVTDQDLMYKDQLIPDIVPAPGYMTDGQGAMWCAVIDTMYGRLPGRATKTHAWYTFGGRDFVTDKDFWIVYRK